MTTSSSSTSQKQHSTNNDKNKSSSDLIVDFPTHRRIKQQSPGKSVRFSTTSELRFFRKPTASENKMKSYTENDYKYFKRVRAMDVIDLSAMLARKQEAGEDLDTEEKCSCIGLELFLSPDVARRFRDIQCTRELHVATVLEEQERQLEKNFFSPSLIARKSRQSSHTAVKNAITLAAAAFDVTI
jgi:hypothetical protein